MSRPLKLTSWRWLLLLAAVSMCLAAGVAWLVDHLGVTLPVVPLTAPGLLGVAAAFVGVLAWRMWQRVQVRKEWVDAGSAIRLLALAKAASWGGATVAGGYVGYLVVFVPAWYVSAARQRLWMAGLAALAAVALVAAGQLLELACRNPNGDEGTETSPTGRPDTP